ncbi:MAG: NAD(+) diphosphatase [Gammaproteobacteria bacterium]|nr:MAG: NAD(+) diphosphatase [Gammaproteobacteria bacterium]
MSELPVTFAASGIDRCTALRREPARLAGLLSSAAARIVPVWQQRCLADGSAALLLPPAQLGLGRDDLARLTLLGRRGDDVLFAIDLAEQEAAGLGTARFRPLPELMGALDAADAALLAYARAMINWQRQHAFCGRCGSANRVEEAGFVMVCSRSGCGARSFPRLDPAIIVLVHRGRRCLLGRQPNWPDGRFSTIAGFVEPGETLEGALRREVREETGIETGACEYLGSQPWPFPASLMIGFHAEALSQDIRLADGELAEARWLSREDIAAGAVTLPPQTSIAFRLIERWFDAGGGRTLAELGLGGPPLRLRQAPAAG